MTIARIEPRVQSVINHLRASEGAPVTRSSLASASGIDPDTAHSCGSRAVDIAVSKARKVLAQDGMRVRSIYNFGYVLERAAA